MGLEPKINLSNIQGLICQGLQLLEGCMWSTQEGGKEGRGGERTEGREEWLAQLANQPTESP